MTVKIVGGYGLRFQLQHMSGLVSWPGNNVVEGMRIGYADGTKNTPCTSAYYGVPHLHVEIRTSPGGNSYTDPLDPWISLRTAYARPGLYANGTVDIQIRDTWIWFATVFGTASVGFPSVADAIGSNTKTTGTTSNTYNIAAIQYLGNGGDGLDPVYKRSGALVHRWFATTAHWVRGAFFKKWRQLGQYNSYLGWPIGNDDFVRQNFQYGCIKIVGSTTYAAPTGSYPCT